MKITQKMKSKTNRTIFLTLEYKSFLLKSDQIISLYLGAFSIYHYLISYFDSTCLLALIDLMKKSGLLLKWYAS